LFLSDVPAIVGAPVLMLPLILRCQENAEYLHGYRLAIFDFRPKVLILVDNVIPSAFFFKFSPATVLVDPMDGDIMFKSPSLPSYAAKVVESGAIGLRTSTSYVLNSFTLILNFKRS
jgi:hypothetical protein